MGIYCIGAIAAVNIAQYNTLNTIQYSTVTLTTTLVGLLLYCNTILCDCFRKLFVLGMDNDMWLVETSDTGPNQLCSPGGTSSGYCSSEEMMTNTSNGFKHVSNVAEPVIIDPLFARSVDNGVQHGGDVAKTNTTFDGFADSLWEPLSTTAVDSAPSCTAPQRHVYHGLMAKQLTASKKPSPTSDDHASSTIGQSMLVLNRHVTSELGCPFAETVDDCRTAVGAGNLPGMSVDVTVSRKGHSGSGKSPTVIIRPVARARGGAPIVSCSTVLRRSATVPSRMPLIAGPGVVSQCGTSKSDHLYSHPLPILHAESTPSIHEALRDHMYALKNPAPSHGSCVDLSKSSRMKSGRGSAESQVGGGGMSILEAFLRSTTPCFDANRGSTAIAAEELRKLNVSGSYVSVKQECGGDTAQSEVLFPSLLKQLLTDDGRGVASEENVGEAHSPGMAVDSVLTDGFGLDVDLQLDDPLSNGIGLLEDGCANAAGQVAADNISVVSEL